MKRFLAFTKSPVGKFHTIFSLFILFNLLSGFVDLFIHYTPWLVSIHFYTGLLILIAPAVFLLLAKNRQLVLKAFSKMALVHKTDFTKVKPVNLLFKLITLIGILLILANALSGIFMKFHLLLPAESYNIHVFIFKVLLAVVPLHVILTFVSHSAHGKKPVKAHRQ